MLCPTATAALSAPRRPLVRWYRGRCAVERHDVHDAGAPEDAQAARAVKPREAVAGKERPRDLLPAVLPATPPRDGRQKGLDVLALELFPHHLLMARPGPDGEPVTGRRLSANTETVRGQGCVGYSHRGWCPRFHGTRVSGFMAVGAGPRCRPSRISDPEARQATVFPQPASRPLCCSGWPGTHRRGFSDLRPSTR